MCAHLLWAVNGIHSTYIQKLHHPGSVVWKLQDGNDSTCYSTNCRQHHYQAPGARKRLSSTLTSTGC